MPIINLIYGTNANPSELIALGIEIAVGYVSNMDIKANEIRAHFTIYPAAVTGNDFAQPASNCANSTPLKPLKVIKASGFN